MSTQKRITKGRRVSKGAGPAAVTIKIDGTAHANLARAVHFDSTGPTIKAKLSELANGYSLPLLSKHGVPAVS